ncbi:MAG: hypothetical protein BHW02_04120 [Clostridium sp. 28_12]|nr:MAG: hypothetical protein BHW02_04120 [Clostridium sp. 28_12]
MKGMAHWLKSSSKMKRWIFLILVGIILTCYGIAKILVQKEMEFIDAGKVVVIFVIGFTCIVLGLIFLNKRNMELFIEATDDRMKNKKNVNVKSLIFDKTIYDKGPKIVAIGGGAGLNTVLAGMKRYTDNITAIVAVSEYGKQPNLSRAVLGTTLPFEEVKDSIVALSAKESNELEKILNHEMENPNLRGLKFSDIYFTAMKEIYKNDTTSIEKSNSIFNIIGNVKPVTAEEVRICAELENGYVVEEKDKIPEIVNDKLTKINRVYLKPSNCKPAPGVLEAIKKADSIIIGPGSLYTNVIPNLLVNGVAKAIKESKAIKIYVNNIMTEPGQTDDYSVEDHIKAIIEHCGEGLIDYCIYDTGEVIPEYIKMYNKEGADLVEQKISDTSIKKIKFIKKNISTIIDGKIRHDPYMIAESAIKLICNDMKYQDKESDPTYIMLNAKLQSDKRISKLKKEKRKRDKRAEKRGINPNTKNKTKSKFSMKYSDRIKSIKESEEHPRRNEQRR